MMMPAAGWRAPAIRRNVVVPAYLALLSALHGRFQDAEAAIPSDFHGAEKFRDIHCAYYAFASIFRLQGKSAETVRWLRKTVEAGMPNIRCSPVTQIGRVFGAAPNLSGSWPN
jgi:hypothetical protein